METTTAVELTENEALILEGLVLFLSMNMLMDFDKSVVALVQVKQLARAIGPDNMINLIDKLKVTRA